MNLENNNYGQTIQPYYSSTGKNKNLKFIIIGLGVLIAAVVVVVVLILGNKNNNSKNNASNELSNGILAIYDTEKPITIEENGLYGFINPSDGSVIVSPKYTDVYGYYGEYAFVESNESGEKKYSIIDRKGNVVKELSSASVYYNSNYDYWIIESELYDSKLNKLSNDGDIVSFVESGFSYTNYNSPYKKGILTYFNSSDNTSGIINEKGKRVYTYSGRNTNIEASSIDWGSTFTFNSTYCAVNVDLYSENQKGAIVNCDTGVVVMDFVDGRVEAGEDNVFGIFSGSSSSSLEKMLYIENDKIAYEEENGDDYTLLFTYVNRYLIITKDRSGKSNDEKSYYLIDSKEHVTTKPEVEEACETAHECDINEYGFDIKECSTGGMGVYKNDELVTTCDYSKFSYISSDIYKYVRGITNKNLFLGVKDNKTYVVDATSGDELFEFNSQNVSGYYVSTFISGTNQDTKGTIVYNPISNKSMEFDKDVKVNIWYNYLIVEQDGVEKYYNTEFKHIYTK